MCRQYACSVVTAYVESPLGAYCRCVSHLLNATLKEQQLLQCKNGRNNFQIIDPDILLTDEIFSIEEKEN